jgi:D-3-phosphoglycerate dehydrogenase
MYKPKALVTAAYSDAELNQLRERFDVSYHNWMERGKAFTKDELKQMVPDKELVIVEVCELQKEVIDAAPNLKIVGCGRGLRGDDSTIDVETLTGRGIPVLFAPGRNLNAVAEFTILMTLALYKKIRPATKWLYDDEWKSWLDFYLTFRTEEISGKRVGLLGFGNIGKRVAKLFNAFGAEVVSYDPFISDEAVYTSNGVKKVELKTLLETSDIVSLHMNVSDENKGFIDAEKIGWMKPSAVLVNSARAVLVDHDALYDALKNKKIAGAAIDVFHSEPATTKTEPLLNLDNVFATPHLGGTTSEVISNHSKMINDGIFKLYNGEAPQFILNPEVLTGFFNKK